MKKCTKCGQEKIVDEFHACRRNKDGLSSHCKRCHADYAAAWRRNNPEKEKAHKKAYYRLHTLKWYESTKAKCARHKELWLQEIEKRFGKPKCSKCGYDKHFAALDFHHTEGNKGNTLGALILLAPTPERLQELNKGIFLCATCHREVHIEERLKIEM